MDVLYLLVPLSVLAMLGVLGVFAWALHGGQFDDIEAEGQRVLRDCSDAAPDRHASGPAATGAECSRLDARQAAGRAALEESPP